MNFTYVIPDIHGRYDLLVRALEEIKTHIQQRPAITGCSVIFLGDYIDRGPQSREVVELLMAGPPEWYCLMGNHEDMMLSTFEERSRSEHWLGNGGDATVRSFIEEGECVIGKKLLAWVSKLPLVIEDDYRVYVHAGLDPNLPMKEQSTETMLWHRYPEGQNVGWRDKHVVHGHSICRGGPLLLSNRTNLDCGAFFTNRLVIGVFDDDVAGGPVEVLETTAKELLDA